jgi:hypothetical protein
MAIFKTGGNFKSNTRHFYINFEYKTHLNFGGNFSKKKVCLIVRKIRYFNYLSFIDDTISISDYAAPNDGMVGE